MEQLIIDGMTGEEFLEEFFEYENCHECGLGAEAHTAGPDMFGKWHAWCH